MVMDIVVGYGIWASAVIGVVALICSDTVGNALYKIARK